MSDTPKETPAPFSQEAVMEEAAQWIATMAMTEGWIDYARARCKQLETDESKLFVGLGKRIKEIIDDARRE